MCGHRTDSKALKGVSHENELERKFVFLQVFTPLDVVAIAIAASGTPTKVSSNMRVSVKKTTKNYISGCKVVQLSLLEYSAIVFCFVLYTLQKKIAGICSHNLRSSEGIDLEFFFEERFPFV
jgi:hypothetical protein